MHDRVKKTILFSGGGTIGPVTPLLAVAEELRMRHDHWSYQWVGTKTGPERKLVAREQMTFHTLPEVKIDRFFSLRNLLVPFRFPYACLKALALLKRVHPDVVLTAGGYVSVPLVLMAKLKRIPSHVHQLDVRPGLANKMMAPFASSISVTFPSSIEDYPKDKTTLLGAPVRKEIFTPSTDSFVFPNEKPVVFIFGGGTGAQAINDFVHGSLEALLTFCNVIHVTGEGKSIPDQAAGYIQREFLTVEMAEAYAKASVVVTRGGLGTFLELAALQKPAIIIPIPESHQEDNAQVLLDRDAAIVLDQTILSPNLFAAEIKKLLNDKERRQKLAGNISFFYRKNAASIMANLIETILTPHNPSAD